MNMGIPYILVTGVKGSNEWMRGGFTFTGSGYLLSFWKPDE